MAPWSRAHTTLAEDLSSVSSTHPCKAAYHSSYRESDFLFYPLWVYAFLCLLIHIHTNNINTHTYVYMAIPAAFCVFITALPKVGFLYTLSSSQKKVVVNVRFHISGGKGSWQFGAKEY